MMIMVGHTDMYYPFYGCINHYIDPFLVELSTQFNWKFAENIIKHWKIRGIGQSDY